MNIISSAKKVCLFSLVLLSVSNIAAMDHLERQRQAAQKREQERINREAKQKIEAAKPTQQVSIDPRANFSNSLAASNHNIKASHNLFMQNQRQIRDGMNGRKK